MQTKFGLTFRLTSCKSNNMWQDPHFSGLSLLYLCIATIFLMGSTCWGTQCCDSISAYKQSHDLKAQTTTKYLLTQGQYQAIQAANANLLRSTRLIRMAKGKEKYINPKPISNYMPFYSERSLTVTEAARPDNHNIEKTSKVSITVSPKIYSRMTIMHRNFWI